MPEITPDQRCVWNNEGRAAFFAFQPMQAFTEADGERGWWWQNGWLAAWSESARLVRVWSPDADEWEIQRLRKLGLL